MAFFKNGMVFRKIPRNHLIPSTLATSKRRLKLLLPSHLNAEDVNGAKN